MKKLTLIVILLSSSLVWAHGNPLEAIDLSVSSALAKFSQDTDKETQDNFDWLKVWPSGSEVKVKVYLKDKSSMTYTCVMSHGQGEAERMECSN